MKRRFMYAAILLVLAGILVVVGLWRRGSAPLLPSGQQTSGGLPGNLAGQAVPQPTGTAGSPIPSSSAALSRTFGMVADVPFLDYYVDGSNSVSGVQPDGQIVRINQGQKTVLASSTVANVIAASFSPDGSRILVSFGAPSAPQYSIFTVAAGAWTPLPLGITRAVWSADSKQIGAVTGQSGGQTLVALDATAAKPKLRTIFALNMQDVSLAWVATSTFLLSEAASAKVQNSIWLLDVKQNTMQPIAFEQGTGNASLWNSRGGYGLLFSSGANKRGGALTLVDNHGQNITNLNFLTLPSKCAFAALPATPQTAVATTTPAKPSAASSSATGVPLATQALLCAVPENSSAFAAATLPDDYEMRALYTSDDIYSIDLGTGIIRPVLSDASQHIDARDLKVFNGKLFLLNRFDQRLYGVSLEN